jgi:S1-C subfamily serine protease
MVVLLLPGVLDTLGGTGAAAPSPEIQDLIDYNGALTEENQKLRDGIGKAICSPDGTYDVPPSGDSPHTQDDIDERLDREDAKSGAIEVTLAWDGPADLDLSVTCPSGPTIGQTIMFNNKRACGGEHDIDMNAGTNTSDRPVEHITWADGAAPPGEYKVNVNYYMTHDAPSTIPYTVEIKVGDNVKRQSKTVQCCNNLTFVDSFVIGAPGTGGPGDGGNGGQGGSTETPPTDTTETPALPKDPQDTVIKRDGAELPLNEAIENGVVFIYAQNPTTHKAGSGSGFLISDRRVVTNNHVVEDATEIFIISEKLGMPRSARVIAHTTGTAEDGQLDFAVLETEAPMTSQAPLAVTPVANRLQQVISAGFPGFMLNFDEGYQRLEQGDLTAAPQIVTTDGIVARPARETDALPLIMHSADIAQGNSGGPLMDICGRVVGVNTLVLQEEVDKQNYHTSWAISGGSLLKFLETNGIAVAKDTAECVPGSSQHVETQPPPDQQGG